MTTPTRVTRRSALSTPSRKGARTVSPGDGPLLTRSGRKAADEDYHAEDDDESSAAEESPLDRQSKGSDEDEDDDVESDYMSNVYFTRSKKKRAPTSGNTSAHIPTVDRSEYDVIRESLPSTTKQIYMQQIERCFDQWKQELLYGYTVLLYGIGSKRESLLKFASTTLMTAGKVLVVNGYDQNVSLKDILTPLSSAPTLSQNAMVEKIMSTTRETTFIIFHNIDAQQFRTLAAQTIFAYLASHPNIHMACSIDHVFASLLWSETLSDQFNFVYHHTPTFAPYHVEIEKAGFSAGVNADLNGARVVSDVNGAKSVLSALNFGQRRTYRILLEARELDQDVYFARCKAQSVATNRATFKKFLGEFTDHAMMQQSEDRVSIPFTPAEVEALVAFLRSFEDEE